MKLGLSMKYAITLTDAAKEALRGMGRDSRRNIGHRINLLADGLQGDVKNWWERATFSGSGSATSA